MIGVVQPFFASALNDIRNGLRRLVVVDGDAHHLGAGPRQRRYLLHGRFNVRRVRVRHRLHHNRCIRPDTNPTNIHRYRTSTLYLRHKLSTLKFITAPRRGPAIHWLSNL